MWYQTTPISDPVVKNVFYKVDEDIPGGLLLVRSDFKQGEKFAVIGTPVNYNLDTRKATLVKVAELHANATDTDTTYQVKKNHQFKVGDIIGRTVGGNAYAITAIDTSNADYDIFTVGTTLGEALTAGDVLLQSSAEGVSACAEKNIANGMLLSTVNIEHPNTSCSVAIEGQYIEENFPYKLHEKNWESLREFWAPA